jgi:hypothetical protein
MHVRRLVSAVALACMVLLLGGALSPAMADSPHFVRASAATDGSGNLVVSFKEAGLGTNQNIDYLAGAEATALYGCVNGGGNHPQARNKESFSGPVTATGTFNSGRNGQVTASLTLSPPGQGALSCPDDMVVSLLQVTYSGVFVTDTTHQVTIEVPGTFSYTNRSVRF